MHRFDTIVDQDISHGAQPVLWDDNTATRIRDLAPHELIVLLTPVVPHSSPGRPTSDSSNETLTTRTDPFECLGQTICSYRKTVHHVPYMPGMGIIPLHRDMIANVSAIVVVNAEPAAINLRAVETSMACQRRFASAVVLETTRYVTDTDDPMPLVMLHCGTRVGAAPGQLKAAYCDYDVILHVKDYAFMELVEAGHVLMGAGVTGRQYDHEDDLLMRYSLLQLKACHL